MKALGAFTSDIWEYDILPAHSITFYWLIPPYLNGSRKHITGSCLLNLTGSNILILLAHFSIPNWLKQVHITGSYFLNPTGSRV